MATLSSQLKLTVLDGVTGPFRRISGVVSSFNRQTSSMMAPMRGVIGSALALGAGYIGVTKGISSTVGAAIKSPVGQQLGGVLKGAAQKALPIIGGAVGQHFGGDSGAKWGQRIGAGAAQLLGVETEGLSHEDESFELAKQYVRFAADAVKNAATATGGDPASVVKAATNQAAQKYAPGLVKGPQSTRTAGSQSGRWVRKGNRIILFGV